MTDNKRDIKYLSILFLCFLFAMLVFSHFTSPLYPNYYGWDSAIFSLVGKGILTGKKLYSDLFDHKGPLIFWINALGNLMGGRAGVFLLQLTSGWIGITFLYFCGKILRGKEDFCKWQISFVVFFLAMCVFVRSCEGGNLTEEYSFPIISCALYFFVKFAAGTQDSSSLCPHRHPPFFAFIYGVCFALLSLLRLNNAVTIGAGVFAIVIYLLYKKEYSNLLYNVFAGFAGLALILLPTGLFFWQQGSFSQMLHAAFLHNFVIAGNTGRIAVTEKPFEFFVLYFPMLLSAGVLLFDVISKKEICFPDCLLGSILIFNLICLWVANRFPHYFTLFVPVYILFLFRYISFKPRSPFVFLVVLCAALNLYTATENSWKAFKEVHVQGNYRHYVVSRDMGQIPENERDSVIGFEVQASDYLSGDIIPCYKYYTLQETWAISSPHILDEFIDYVDEEEPLWLLTTKLEPETELDRIISEKYEPQFYNEYLLFYRLGNK